MSARAIELPRRSWTLIPGGMAIRKVLSALVTVVVMGLLWEWATAHFRINPLYLPPLSDVFRTVMEAKEAFFDSAIKTVVETVIGYVLGVLFGLLSAYVFFEVKTFRSMFFPVFIVSQTVPVIAFGAIVVMVFGNGLASKAIIAFYLTFFPVTVNALAGLLSVSQGQVALLRSFGASGWQVFWRLRFPAALPSIFVALRLSVTLALIGAIVGEWFGDTSGLGVLLLSAMFYENSALMWGAILATAVVGAGLYGIVAAIEAAVVFWKEEM
jgi:NitT/TauT family transport system permease protein